MTLEENLITGLNKERKGMIDCGQQTHIHMPVLPLTESGALSRLLHSPEPQFPNLKDGNNGVVVKMKWNGRTGHLAVHNKD